MLIYSTKMYSPRDGFVELRRPCSVETDDSAISFSPLEVDGLAIDNLTGNSLADDRFFDQILNSPVSTSLAFENAIQLPPPPPLSSLQYDTVGFESDFQVKLHPKKREGGVCRVCGDVATGMYFGALVCVPCKTFYLRYTGTSHTFVCKDSCACAITVANRTNCKFCRYQKCLRVGMHRKERPSQVQIADGQQICAVCQDVANGVHFGVITCEGCKKFFRRGLLEHHSYACKNDRNCEVNPRTRNACRFCRYQKCLYVGMSREAIQMGRPSKPRFDKDSSAELFGKVKSSSESGQIQQLVSYNLQWDDHPRSQNQSISYYPVNLTGSNCLVSTETRRYSNAITGKPPSTTNLVNRNSLNLQQKKLDQDLADFNLSPDDQFMSFAGGNVVDEILSPMPGLASISGDCEIVEDSFCQKMSSGCFQTRVSVSDEMAVDSCYLYRANENKFGQQVQPQFSSSLINRRTSPAAAASVVAEPVSLSSPSYVDVQYRFGLQSSSIDSNVQTNQVVSSRDEEARNVAAQHRSSSSSASASGDLRRLTEVESPFKSVFRIVHHSVASELPDSTQCHLPINIGELMSRFEDYWSCDDTGEVPFLVHYSEIYKEVISAYQTFVVHSQQVNRLLRMELEKCQNSSGCDVQWIQDNVIPFYVELSIRYCRQLPGFSSFDLADQQMLIRLGQSPSRILAAAVHWYRPKENDFGDFLSWRRNDRFKTMMAEHAAKIKALDLDVVEAALLNAAIVIATDYPNLVNSVAIEKQHQMLLAAYKTYITGKLGMPNDRVRSVIREMREIRHLGYIHYEMTKTKNMKAEDVTQLR